MTVFNAKMQPFELTEQTVPNEKGEYIQNFRSFRTVEELDAYLTKAIPDPNIHIILLDPQRNPETDYLNMIYLKGP